MIRTWIQNRWNDHIPAHYIIWYKWDVVQSNPLDDMVWAIRKDKYNTEKKVDDGNMNWIHIEMVGNFNEAPPTEAQYKALNKLINELKLKYDWIEIKYHQDFQSKNCPWIYFNRNFMDSKPTTKNKYITFQLSRYYSPVPNQERYYNNKTYEQDVTMNCGKWAINNDSCLIPADGKRYTDADIYKSVACPPEYKLWTKIHLEWIWVVTCRDRWSAIQNNRLDMRCWQWMEWLNNWNSCPTGIRKGYILK